MFLPTRNIVNLGGLLKDQHCFDMIFSVVVGDNYHTQNSKHKPKTKKSTKQRIITVKIGLMFFEEIHGEHHEHQIDAEEEKKSKQNPIKSQKSHSKRKKKRNKVTETKRKKTSHNDKY